MSLREIRLARSAGRPSRIAVMISTGLEEDSADLLDFLINHETGGDHFNLLDVTPLTDNTTTRVCDFRA